jgi:tRNA (mo5U34)-methyltransferase
MERIVRLTTSWPQETIEHGLRAREPWFYAYEFTNGAQSVAPSAEIQEIHAYRAEAIFSHLDRLFAGRWTDVRCLDLACHEGWFSMQIAQRGAAAVRGIDIRPDHIEKARWIAEAGGVSNAQFQTEDLFALSERSNEQHDIVLCLGILYHLENPMGAVRVARQFTKNVCVIETLVSRTATMHAAKTGYPQPREGPGAIVLPSDPVHGHEPAGIAIIPSLPAFHLMLQHAGFRAIHLVMPTPTASPLFQSYDRVILFAYV